MRLCHTENVHFANDITACRREEAINRPKSEFIPKTLSDIVVEPISDGLNGAHHPPPPQIKHINSTKGSRGGYARAHRNPPPPTIGWNLPADSQVKRKIFIFIYFSASTTSTVKLHHLGLLPWCPFPFPDFLISLVWLLIQHVIA
jgi:hypothetical protein